MFTGIILEIKNGYGNFNPDFHKKKLHDTFLLGHSIIVCTTQNITWLAIISRNEITC